MIDPNEMRRRRVERLAALEKAAAEKAKTQPSQAITKQEAESKIEDQNSKPQKLVAAAPPATFKTPEPSPDSKKDTSIAKPLSSKPVKALTTSRYPSVFDVFQLPESGEEVDWTVLASNSGFDSLLFEKITSGTVRPLVYLNECYQRAERLTGPLATVKDAVQQSILTMAFICATASEEDEVHDNLSSALLDAAYSNTLSKQFVLALFGQIAINEEEAFQPLIIQLLSHILKSLDFGSARTASSYGLLEILIEVPGFVPLILYQPRKPSTPATISRETFLGQLLNVGAGGDGLLRLLTPEVVSSSSLDELSERAKMTEPMTQLLDQCQFKFVEKLVRLNKEARRSTLNWFVMLLDANHSQLATNRIPGKTNSLQLMLNAFKILLRFAEPFMKLDYVSLMQQLSKVNLRFFADANSYDVSDETKILASEKTPFNSRDQDLGLNFVTECFYLCAGLLHFGFHATIQSLTSHYKQQISHLERELEAMNQDSTNRMTQDVQRITVLRFKGYLQKYKTEYCGLRCVVHNSEFIRQVLQFSEFNLAFAIYAAEGCPSALEIRVPWDKDPPGEYGSLPEFLVEAPLASASWILRTVEFMRSPNMSMNNQLLIDAAIFFMSSPNVLRNPYLRSKFVEILFYGGSDIPLTSGSTMPGTLSSLFTTSQTCRKFLLPALMSVFIDIEHTGRASQFYEKFNTRELVANVLKVIWRDPHYRDQLVTESQSQPDFFIKFVALLLNDATFLLDEALTKLLEVHKLQNNPTQGEGSAGQPHALETDATNQTDASMQQAEEEQEHEMTDGGEAQESANPADQLESVERQVQNFLQLSNSTMTLLYTFTSTVPHIFAIPEIIDRFAVMLNYNLAALVGPRCNELKVRNPADLGFSPRQLLTDLVRVYLNLRNEPPFPKSLAKDERSYNDNNFTKAQNILSKFSLISPIELDNFADLAKRTREAKKEAEEEEEDYGDDVPDEYLDPLMFEIMENPVTLPTSKNNIDLSTIKSHLLSDPTDPFNRVPLKIEDVIPNPELKAKIEDFKKMKRQQRQEKRG